MPRGKKCTNGIKSKMKVVVLHGRHNSGKTTTFNCLYHKLLGCGAKEIEPKKELPGKHDFECILQYNGKKIALFSLGDYMFAVGCAVGYYTRTNSDVLVVAHSLKSSIHKNSLFQTRQYHYAIINKELDGICISDDEAVEKIIAEIE